MKTYITFIIISRSSLLRMGNILDKSCRIKQNTRSVFSKFSIPPTHENCAVCDITWKMSGRDRQAADMTIQNGAGEMQFACRVCGTRMQTHTHTHTRY